VAGHDTHLLLKMARACLRSSLANSVRLQATLTCALPLSEHHSTVTMLEAMPTGFPMRS
jgi:hypothetical protein